MAVRVVLIGYFHTAVLAFWLAAARPTDGFVVHIFVTLYNKLCNFFSQICSDVTQEEVGVGSPVTEH